MSDEISFYINDKLVSTRKSSTQNLLDFIRDLGLTGTKTGCREGDCGACTVIIGEKTEDGMSYKTVVSCLTPLGNVVGKQVITVESLESDINSIQGAFIDTGATQCGFCTPGFILSLTVAKISGSDLKTSVDGNICRCTGYNSILRAIDIVNAEPDKPKLVLQDDIQSKLEKLKVLEDGMEKNTGILIGGGTDLYVQQSLELQEKSAEFISNKYNFIIKGEMIEIGAGTTMSEFMNSDLLEPIIDMSNFTLIASTQIRNMATIAGNLVNASPIADFAIILLALDASLTLTGVDSERILSLDQFYLAYKNIDLKEDEHIYKISIPIKNTVFNFEKVSKRTHLDIASVNSASAIIIDDGIIQYLRISIGGVAPIPMLLIKTCEYLIGKRLDAEVLKNAIKIAGDEISPISDIRGSSAYKRLLTRQMIVTHMKKYLSDDQIMEVIR